MMTLLLFPAGVLVGYGLALLLRPDRMPDEAIYPPVTMTLVTVDPITHEPVGHDTTYLLGGRVPQEPT